MSERELGTNRKVIAIQGDEATPVHHPGILDSSTGSPIFYVIVRNGAYNILKSLSEYLISPGVPGYDLPGIDTVAIAKGEEDQVNVSETPR